MKKIVCMLVAAMTAVSAFSQEVPELRIAGTEDGLFALDGLSHVGWGYSFVTTDEFTPKGSGQFFVNIVNLKFKPAESLCFQLGADAVFNYFGSRTSIFTQTRDHLVQVGSDIGLVPNGASSRSSINTFSIGVPLLVNIDFGGFVIGAGAEADFNLVGTTRYSFKSDDMRSETISYKAKVNTFNYGIVGFIGFGGLDVYAKFYPKGSRLLPEGSVNFSWWTLGIALGL